VTARTGTIYLLHFDRPYRHAGHYVGNPERLRFLNGRGAPWGGEFAELADWPVLAGRGRWRFWVSGLTR
jgi:hypothetical protein